MSNIKPPSKSALSGKKKAAIFIISLGNQMGSEVLKHLKDDEVEQVCYEIVRLNQVFHEEKEIVLREFHEMLATSKYILDGGIDYATDILEKSMGAERAAEIINNFSTSFQLKPFDFIRKIDHQHLSNFLQTEHPQTIALVLTYLDPKKAADILSQIPPELQNQVAKRIAKMNRIVPDAVREVESVLERKLSTVNSEDFSITGGIDSTAKILNLADRSTEKSIIESLEENDPELAEEIKKRMFVFEDIVVLDDSSIQKFLRKINDQDLTKALKSVDDEVKEKIFRNMSKRAAEIIQDDIEYMGPTRLSDVEEAQQRIVAVIRKLEEQGEIIIARLRENDIVV